MPTTEREAAESSYREIGPYRILGVLGEGGMGVVYVAEHSATHQRVALKTVARTTPQTLAGIRTEVAALRAARHPRIVRIFEDGQDGGLPWYAMELLEGRTLAHLNAEIWPATRESRSLARTASTADVARQPDGIISDSAVLSRGAAPAVARPSADGVRTTAANGRLRETIALYRQLCAPLGHIHGLGMVHRDLTPRNVFIRSDGSPVLMDFGLMALARGAIGRESLGIGTRALGTVRYVAPEQVQGRPLDARADLYALGCMLYETLTSRAPFEGSSPMQTVEAHVSVPPVPPAELVDGIPLELDELVRRLLSKRPEDRFGHADDVAAVLAKIFPEDGATKEQENPSYLYRSQLAGRQDALGQLMAFLPRLHQGKGGFVLLRGESGIGKTFVASEFGHRAVDMRINVVTGDCLPPLIVESRAAEAVGEPLQPFRRFLQYVADQCREKDSPLVERLVGGRASLLAQYEPALEPFAVGSHPPEIVPAPAARDRILKCLGDTLAALAENGALLLILDDLQWADDLSLAFLLSLTPSFFENCPILILGTLRSDEGAPALKQLLERAMILTLTLGRVDDVTVGRVAGGMLAMSAPPAPLVDFLVRTSEGNPFFVAEYVRLLVAKGFLHRKHGRWTLAEVPSPGAVDAFPVPGSLQGILNRRLETLPPDALALLECAAVLGRELEPALLGDMLGREPERVFIDLRESLSRQIVEQIDGGRYRYVHDTLRETCYRQIPQPRRKLLHGRAARAIERALGDHRGSPGTLAQLAFHFKQASDTHNALKYLERAGNEALAMYANREAATLFKDALQLVDSGAVNVDALRHARWRRLVGDALQGLGNLDESAAHLKRALEILGWPAPQDRRYEMVRSVLKQVLRQFSHRARLGHLERDPARAERFLEAARAYDRLQQVLFYRGEALPMLQACLSSLNFAERAPPSVELVTAYANAHAVAGIVPAPQLAEAYLRRAHQVLENKYDPNADTYVVLLSINYQTGRAAWDDAKREGHRGFALARDIGFRRRGEEIIGMTGVAHFLAGEFSEALACATLQYESALRGDVQAQCWGRLGRAQALLVLDRLDEAEVDIEQAGDLAMGLGRAERIWTNALLAVVRLRQNDRERACAAIARGIEEVREKPPVSSWSIAAYHSIAEVSLSLLEPAAKLEPRERDALERQAAHALQAVKTQSARVYRAARPGMWLARGNWHSLHGHHARAVHCWERSLQMARELKMPYHEGRAHLSLGRQARRGEASAARNGLRDHLDQAAALFARVGALHDLRQSRA